VWINYVLLVFVALLILWTIWKDKLRLRRWLTQRDMFLVFSGIFVIMFFRMPRFIGTGGLINERLNLFYIPILLPWLNVDFHKAARWCVVGVMIFLSLFHLGYTYRDYYGFSREMADFNAAVGLLPDHVVFRRTESDDWGSFKWQSLPHVATFFYYGLQGDRVFMNNYEAEFNYFPFNFKGENRRDYYAGGIIDYYLSWNTKDDSPLLEGYKQDYDITYSGPRFKVLRHKNWSQSLRMWEQNVGDAKEVSFNMGSTDSAPAGGVEGGVTFHTSTDKRYQFGGFGWDTIYPRYSAEYGVWDTEDAAFRIDLPNGDYEVTCRFKPNDGQTYRVDLYANGRRAIQNRQVSGRDIEERYVVEVTDGSLIQVIHATSRERSIPWVWSGFTLYRL